MVDGILELDHVVEALFPDLVLQVGEEPVVWRQQIWTEAWMRDQWNAPLVQKVHHNVSPVRRCTVMQKTPAVCTELLRAIPSDLLTQLLDDAEIGVSVNAMSIQNKHSVHHPNPVEEDDQHGFGNCSFSQNDFGSLLTICSGDPLPVLEL